MVGRYRISLNGVEMDSLFPANPSSAEPVDEQKLAILDIGYSSPEKTPITYRVANLDGYDYNAPYFEKQTVTVTFELHAYDTAERNSLCQLINNWAKAGGVLRTSDRPGQQLRDVRCEQFASVASVRNWTDPFTLVFSTTYNPYWQSEDEKTLTIAGAYASGSLAIDGNISESLVTATITAEGAVNALQINVGTTSLRLTGLSLANGGKLIIDYVKGRYLRIRQNGASAMDKLQASSSDVLSIPCGTTKNVTITATSRVVAVITARGLWL